MSFYRNMTIAFILVVALLTASGCAKRSLQEATLPDPAEKRVVVAKVNGADISLYTLHTIMNRINLDSKQSLNTEEVRKIALEQVILRELTLQEAARQGVPVDPREIEQVIISTVGHSESDYADYLEKAHMTDAEFRAEVRNNILLRRLFQKEVLSKVNVSDEEVRKEYAVEKDRLMAPEKLTVTDIIMPSRPDAAASLVKANTVRADIASRKDLGTLAQDQSITVRTLDLEKEKEPVLYDAARGVKDGEVTEVVKSGENLHILKVVHLEPAKQLSYEEAKTSLEGKLKAKAFKQRVTEWQQELKNKATIEIGPPGSAGLKQ